jgi:hypothetical protein
MYQQRSAVDVTINEQLRSLAARYGLVFMERQSLVCPSAVQRCDIISADGKLLYSDRSHWTYAGRKQYGKLMLDAFETGPLRPRQ